MHNRDDIDAGLFCDNQLVDPKGLFSYTVLPGELIARRDLSHSEKLALARLLRRRWDPRSRTYLGEAKMSLEKLAERTGLALRTIEGAVPQWVYASEIATGQGDDHCQTA